MKYRNVLDDPFQLDYMFVDDEDRRNKAEFIVVMKTGSMFCCTPHARFRCDLDSKYYKLLLDLIAIDDIHLYDSLYPMDNYLSIYNENSKEQNTEDLKHIISIFNEHIRDMIRETYEEMFLESDEFRPDDVTYLSFEHFCSDHDCCEHCPKKMKIWCIIKTHIDDFIIKRRNSLARKIQVEHDWKANLDI